jgi:hypothetical protein
MVGLNIDITMDDGTTFQLDEQAVQDHDVREQLTALGVLVSDSKDKLLQLLSGPPAQQEPPSKRQKTNNKAKAK